MLRIDALGFDIKTLLQSRFVSLPGRMAMFSSLTMPELPAQTLRALEVSQIRIAVTTREAPNEATKARPASASNWLSRFSTSRSDLPASTKPERDPLK
ncbi:MAG: hypothetical protein Q7O66_14205 [Dehalococcoidia bacterium]|nr:hypothetical protein [Dehalococcoidia bacterium]